MTRYALRRVLVMIPVLVLASIAIWAMILILPGSPAHAIAGENATTSQIALVNERLGLDRPWYEQYGSWLNRVRQGDLGSSYLADRAPVLDIVMRRIPATIQLALCSMVIGILIAAVVGTVSALRPRSLLGRLATVYQNIILAVPTFWLAILLLLLLAVKFKLFQIGGLFVSIWENPIQGLQIVFLPALALGLHVSGMLAMFVRASLSATMEADFIRTARAKGADEFRVVRAHAARNALMPVVTIIGLNLAGFLGGTVVVETIFNYPGLGALILSSVSSRDYAVIQGTLLFVVVVFLTINLLVDLIYAWIDPRVRLAATNS